MLCRAREPCPFERVAVVGMRRFGSLVRSALKRQSKTPQCRKSFGRSCDLVFALALCPHGRGLRALACRAQNLHEFVAARSSGAAFPWLSYAVFIPSSPSSRSEGGHVALVRHCAGVPSHGLSGAAVFCWFGSGRWASRACDGSYAPPGARDGCSDGMRSHGKVFKRDGFLSDHIFWLDRTVK